MVPLVGDRCEAMGSKPSREYVELSAKMSGTVAAGALVFLTTRPPVSSGRYSRLPCCFNRSVISLCCFITFASRFSPGFPPGAEARVCGPTLLRPVGSNQLRLGIWIGGLRESVDHGQEVVVVALLVGTFLVLADDITPHPLHLVKIPIIVNLVLPEERAVRPLDHEVMTGECSVHPHAPELRSRGKGAGAPVHVIRQRLGHQ